MGATGAACDVDAATGGERFALTADGRRIAYRVLGPGRPGTERRPRVVVWVSGMGASGLSWAPLHRRAAELNRSVVFDRAGLGNSDEDPEPPALARSAADLIAVLEEVVGSTSVAVHDAEADASSAAPPLPQAPETPPRIVLAAHSWGGPIARVAAAARPDLVSGLVLIDPSDEHLALRSRHRSTGVPLLRAAGILTGLMRIRAAKRCPDPGFPLPEPVARELRRQELSARSARTYRRETAEFDRGLAELRAEPRPARGIPVTLVSGTRLPRIERIRRRRLAMVSAHERAAAEQPSLRLVRAERSGHLVHLTEPGLVLSEVLRMLGPDASDRARDS